MRRLPEGLQDPPFTTDQVGWLQRWMDYWRVRARILIGVSITFVVVAVAGLVLVVVEKEQLRESIRRDVGVAVVCSAEDSARTLVAVSFRDRTPTAAEKQRAEDYIAEQRAKAEERVKVLLQGKPVNCDQPAPRP